MSIVVNQSMSIFNIKMYCCEVVMGVWQQRKLRKVRENIVKFRNLSCSNRYVRHFKLKYKIFQKKKLKQKKWGLKRWVEYHYWKEKYNSKLIKVL